ncbi:pitrilysin family protein [Sulfuriferula sp.]|uniref:M16 family metallopeptidase n=1 Tax=Sulfuriferula sp. TaxID=2025307 RepID=UPI00273058B3|nr:pitrilysin family protein [Sulfuriferula sp.]MDP2025245.1 pitrilysin family protein [Sulfuriferula sp.]
MRFWMILLALCASMSAHAALPIQHWVLANGAKVYFVENHDLPMLDVSVDFPAGTAAEPEPASQGGVASLTRSLLSLGAGGLDDNQIARGLGDVGAVLGGRFDADRAGITLRTLSSPTERTVALEMLARMVQQPTFSDTVLAREKARVIAALKQAELQPESLAARAFQQAVFGSHPYARRDSGEIASVSRLASADLRAFYRSHYAAQGAVIALIGDISRTDAERVAQQLTAALPPASQAANLAIPPVPVLPQAVTRTIPFPAKQSQVLIGQPGVTRADPDYFALYVGNYVLGGGGFDSRLLDEVRQKRGLAYSAYSYFSPMRASGVFQMGLQTRVDQTQQAVQVVRDTLAEFVENGVSEAELTQAKNNIVGGFPLRIDSNKKILEYLAVIGFYDLPLNYLDAFPARIEAVTAAQIQAAFKRHVHSDRMVTVIVGGGTQ